MKSMYTYEGINGLNESKYSIFKFRPLKNYIGNRDRGDFWNDNYETSFERIRRALQ